MATKHVPADATPRSASAKPILAPVYGLKVALQGIRPPIWRRLEISGAMNLKQLHLAIQAAMGWHSYHLYMFTIDGLQYGEPDPELHCTAADSVTLCDVLRGKTTKCVYEYDFGDSWEHKVTVEAITAEPAPAERPTCLDGRRACPPEDCGGFPGYEQLLAALRDPDDPEHAEMVTWVGGRFDAEHFDLDAANRRLQRQRGLTPRGPKKGAGGRTARPKRAAPGSAEQADPPALPLLPGMTPDDMQVMTLLLADVLAKRGLTLETADASNLERIIWEVHAEALVLGMRALAAQRGIVPDASGARRG